MRSLRGTTWGPTSLPEYLTRQLDAHGFGPGDAGRAARLITEQSKPAAAASLFVDLGACKFLEGDLDGAIAAWRHAISSGHDDAAARALLDLGLLYEHVELHEAALGVLGTCAARNVDPYVIPAVMASARCQRQLGHTEASVESMARLAQRIMSVDPERPELVETLYGLGDVALESGRTDRAERAWKVAARSGDADFSHAAAGRLVSLLADRADVAQLLELLDDPSVKLDGSGAETLLQQAAELLDRGDRSASRRLIERVDSSVLGVAGRFRLADLRIDTGEVNRGIDELESLLAHAQPTVRHRAAFQLGEIYSEHDMNEVAVSMLEQVVAARDRYWSPRAALVLGDLHGRTGDPTGAHAQWELAAQCPEDELRLAAQERLAAVAERADASSRSESDRVETDDLPASRAADGNTRRASDPEPQVVRLTPITDADPGGPPATHTNGRVEVIALDDLERDQVGEDPIEPTAGADVVSTFTDRSMPAHLQNPYASLAPGRVAAGSSANPYAELAPTRIDRKPPPNVETGDWESMLEEWPEDDEGDPPSAFSRHTR